MYTHQTWEVVVSYSPAEGLWLCTDLSLTNFTHFLPSITISLQSTLHTLGPLCPSVCYALLCLVSQSCLTLCDTMDLQAPLSMGILQARILEWVAMPSSRGSSRPRDQSQVSLTEGGFFTSWANREAPLISMFPYKSRLGRRLPFSLLSLLDPPNHYQGLPLMSPTAPAADASGETGQSRTHSCCHHNLQASWHSPSPLPVSLVLQR